MSAVIKTITPFIHRELLLKALDVIDCKYKLTGNEIITERIDYYGHQKFVLVNGRFQLQHDSSANMVNYPWRNLNVKEYKTVSSFLQAVEKEYNALYQKKLEELERIRLEELAEQERKRLEAERMRLEQERITFIEQQKMHIIEKAKEKGYSVHETKVGTKVKLVLVKNTYK